MPSRRDVLRASLGSLAPALDGAVHKPHVLLLMADDLGYECLGCYGGTSYRTPHLDRMAAQGVRFTHAYAQPLCTPTRIQLMTGLYNHRNWRAFGVMDPQEVTIGHRMKQAGYRTAIAGKWQLFSYNPPDYEPQWRGRGMLPRQSGFEQYCLWHAGHTEDKGSRYAEPTFERNGTLVRGRPDQYGEDIFSDFLLRFLERHRNEPVFAYYPMALTHGPFNPTPRSSDWHRGDRLRNDTRYFADMVEYMDEIVGRMLDRLDQLGLAERTLVLFYSDNGTDKSIQSRMGEKVVRGGKGLTTDAGTRVPLLAWWKGVTPRGAVLEDLVDSTDFLPTILEAAGAEVPAGLDGWSFLPQLRGQRGQPRQWTYCWYDPRPGWDKSQYRLVRYARNQRFKLYDDGRLFDIPADELEQRPILDGQGSKEAEIARVRLQGVLRSMAAGTAPARPRGARYGSL